MTLLASSDTNTGSNVQKSHAASHFDHLETRNVMLLLTMPSSSCDVDGTGVT